MISELVSEFMPDDVLACGESGGGKAKSGIIGGVIQLICTSLAKKMIILRLKSGGKGLFNGLFVYIVNWRVLCHYILDVALYDAGS